jgi:hypothetical protein
MRGVFFDRQVGCENEPSSVTELENEETGEEVIVSYSCEERYQRVSHAFDSNSRKGFFCKKFFHTLIFPGSARAQAAMAVQSRKSPTGDFAFFTTQRCNHESFSGSSLPAKIASATGRSGLRAA